MTLGLGWYQCKGTPSGVPERLTPSRRQPTDPLPRPRKATQNSPAHEGPSFCVAPSTARSEP